MVEDTNMECGRSKVPWSCTLHRGRRHSGPAARSRLLLPDSAVVHHSCRHRAVSSLGLHHRDLQALQASYPAGMCALRQLLGGARRCSSLIQQTQRLQGLAEGGQKSVFQQQLRAVASGQRATVPSALRPTCVEPNRMCNSCLQTKSQAHCYAQAMETPSHMRGSRFTSPRGGM